MIKSACMDIRSRLHLLLSGVQNLIPEHGLTIVAAERYSREVPHWLLTVAHISGFYEKSTRSSDLINLLGSASSHEDLLLSLSRSFLQILKNFSEIKHGLLEEMKR